MARAARNPDYAQLRAALEQHPRQPQAWLDLARHCYRDGDWEQAQEILDGAQAAGMLHPELDTLRAAMAGQAGGDKVFCVGRNKTGTTTLEHALQSLGYRMGLQARGEVLLRDWAARDFQRIFALCQTADAFQDTPFSCAETYRAVDVAYPGSKFILTVREPALWFDSLLRFHTAIIGHGRKPTAQDLASHPYRYPGFLWDAARLIYGATAESLYDRERYIAHFLEHNQQVQDYFRHRPQDLLVLDVAEPAAMQRLCAFLGKPDSGRPMPHLNQSARRNTLAARWWRRIRPG